MAETDNRSFHVQHYSRRTKLGLGPVEHRWRAISSKNRETLCSGEGYHNFADLKSTVYMLFGRDVRLVAVPR